MPEHQFLIHFHNRRKSVERREWDSNPRALSDKRFSRPPRYDHFDISPQTCLLIIPEKFLFVKSFFIYFLSFFRICCCISSTRLCYTNTFPQISQAYFLIFFNFFNKKKNRKKDPASILYQTAPRVLRPFLNEYHSQRYENDQKSNIPFGKRHHVCAFVCTLHFCVEFIRDQACH